MEHICPKCSCSGSIIRSRFIADGSKRLRVECRSQNCRHRWTVAIGKPLREDAERCAQRPPLTEAQVRFILTSGLSLRKLSPVVDRSRPVISAVLTGKAYADLCPDLPRRAPWQNQRTCLRCIKWTGDDCELGWPDPVIEGPEFARYCDDYERR